MRIRLKHPNADPASCSDARQRSIGDKRAKRDGFMRKSIETGTARRGTSAGAPRVWMSATLVAALAIALGSSAPATASGTSGVEPSSVPTPDETVAVASIEEGWPGPDEAPLDTNIPEVAAKIAEIEAAGGEVMGGTTVSYERVEDAKGGAQMMTFPSGCSLSVILWQSRGTINSDNMTACLSSYSSVSMESHLAFLAWAHYNNILESDGITSYNRTSVTMNYDYFCADRSNTTWFRTVTQGYMSKGGSNYTASAYDLLQSSSCGT